MSLSGVPLQDVGILLELFPYTEVGRTNKSGHFSVIDSCENISYTVKKNDYIPFRLEVGIRGATPLLIQLEDSGVFETLAKLVSFIYSLSANKHVCKLFQISHDAPKVTGWIKLPT